MADSGRMVTEFENAFVNVGRNPSGYELVIPRDGARC